MEKVGDPSWSWSSWTVGEAGDPRFGSEYHVEYLVTM